MPIVRLAASVQVGAVDVGHAKVGVGIVYRTKLARPAGQHWWRLEPTSWTSGSADDRAVVLLNGSGRERRVDQERAGNTIVIPAGVGHWFTRIHDIFATS